MDENKTILLVEDEAPVALQESSILESHGFNVEIAYSPETAIEIVKNSAIDCVLMDINLGKHKTDGTEVARKITTIAEVPIIFLTGHGEKEYVEKIGGIKNYGYLLKGSGEFVMVEWIKMALQLHATQKSLRRKEIEAREIVNNIDSAILQYDTSGKIIFCSKGVEKMFGYSANELIGTTGVGTINPRIDGNGVEHQKLLSSIMVHPEQNAYHENENNCKDGNRLWVAWRNTAVYDEEGTLLYIQSIGTDITHQKKALEEKDFLMQELNHRVKNNLAMISSLIHLKSYSLQEGVDLSDIERQIDAIRIVHDKLFQSGDVIHIDFNDYISELLTTIFSSFSRNKVTINSKIDPISVKTKTTIALGLIVNELATNAIKYGFKEHEEAVFSIEMKESTSEKGMIIMTVSNSGNPFPEHIDFNNSDTLGLRLISALILQLDGKIELQSKPYPVFTITFSLEE